MMTPHPHRCGGGGGGEEGGGPRRGRRRRRRRSRRRVRRRMRRRVGQRCRGNRRRVLCLAVLAPFLRSIPLPCRVHARDKTRMLGGFSGCRHACGGGGGGCCRRRRRRGNGGGGRRRRRRRSGFGGLGPYAAPFRTTTTTPSFLGQTRVHHPTPITPSSPQTRTISTPPPILPGYPRGGRTASSSSGGGGLWTSTPFPALSHPSTR